METLDGRGPFGLAGRTAIVTGASRGIGLAIARVFVQAGAAVLVIARDAARLQDAATGLAAGGATVALLAGDVGDPALAPAAMAAARERLGGLDILVNNAGIGGSGPVEEIDLARWEQVQAANLRGPYLLARAAAPLLQERGGGRIINVASISGQTGGVSAGVHYSASKGGLIAMTKTLARDLAPWGITVNAIAPGQIETAMGSLSPAARESLLQRIPLRRLGTPDDIAYAALYLASAADGYLTGATLDVNGGILMR